MQGSVQVRVRSQQLWACCGRVHLDVEADAGLPAFEGSRVSPAPTKALTGHETDALLPKCRVIIGVEAGEIECPVYGE